MKRPDAALLDGQRESRTLTEGLAVDIARLLRLTFPDLKLTVAEEEALVVKSFVARMAAAGRALQREYELECLPTLMAHTSDTVRAWAPYVIGAQPRMSLANRLKAVRPSADDSHFGVREWAWLGIRTHLAADIEAAIALLRPWTTASSPRVRRFATEATRPRGVWAVKIDHLLQTPSLGLPLLDALYADSEVYVQDSVANWVNDAAKSNPAWAVALCARWERENSKPSVARVCKRALRSVKRKAA